MKYLLLITALLMSCGSPDRRAKNGGATDKTMELGSRSELKKLELETLLDQETGWPSTKGCDQLLWASLTKAIGLDVDLTLAEYAPGEMHRRPPPACWDGEDKGSKSTISQDMITGYLWAIWRSNDVSALKRLASYGESRSLANIGWIMGEPYPERADRVVMRTNLIGLVGRMLLVLSGDQKTYRYWPPKYFRVRKDYERHIQALGIALQGEIYEAIREKTIVTTDITDHMLDRVNDLVSNEPDNVLFNAILARYTGDFGRAIDLLLGDTTPTPTYIRGKNEPALKLIHWIFAASLVLERIEQ